MDPQFQPLMDAAYQGDLSRFKSLIADCPELVTQPSSISHPNLFQFVVVEGGLGKIPNISDFVQFIVECGTSLDYPLIAAASVNSREIVDQLLDSGASVESCHPWTALEEALYWAHQELGVYLWLKRGSQVFSLRAASELGELELMKEYFDGEGNLLACAGPVRFPFEGISYSPDDVINQALILSLKNHQYDAADMLIENGADVNSIPPGNHERCTPLHQAVYMNDLQMVDWLMERGADVAIKDPRFKSTAIGWANHFGYGILAKHIESK